MHFFCYGMKQTRAKNRKLHLRTGLGDSDIQAATLIEVADCWLASLDGQITVPAQNKTKSRHLLVSKLIPLPPEGYFLELHLDLDLDVCTAVCGALASTIIRRLPDGTEQRVGFGLPSPATTAESFKSGAHIQACILEIWPRLLPRLSDMHPPYFDQTSELRLHPHSGSSSINYPRK